MHLCCCNGSLQTGTRIIAIVQQVFASLLSLFGILHYRFGGSYECSCSDENDEDFRICTMRTSGSISSIIAVAVGVLYIFVAVSLLMGTIKRNRTFCMVWFVLSVIFVILGVLGILRDFTSGDKHSVFYTFPWALLQSYFLWVVWALSFSRILGPTKEILEYSVAVLHNYFHFMPELKEEAALSPDSYPKPRV